MTVATASVAGALALVAAGGGTSAPSAQHARLHLHPRVARRGHAATISVTNVYVPSLEVKVVGGTSSLGKPLPWRRLRFLHGGWYAVLPIPALRGVYPLELRVREGGQLMDSDGWLLRVFARGTLSRPSFTTPEDVAAWWVRTMPFDGHIVATRRWPLSADDRRDPSRHQKVVVAYTVRGHRAVNDRLGIFVTAVRARRHGRWRLLEATVAP